MHGQGQEPRAASCKGILELEDHDRSRHALYNHDEILMHEGRGWVKVRERGGGYDRD